MGKDPKIGIVRDDQSTSHIGVPQLISLGDIAIREMIKTGIIKVTTSEKRYVTTMINLALKGHMIVTAMVENMGSMNAEVVTLI